VRVVCYTCNKKDLFLLSLQNWRVSKMPLGVRAIGRARALECVTCVCVVCHTCNTNVCVFTPFAKLGSVEIASGCVSNRYEVATNNRLL